MELGCSRDTITRKLRERRIQPDSDGCYTPRDIFHALVGDYKTARTRECEARAKLLEAEVEEKAGNVMSREAVVDAIYQWLGPIRQRFDSLPAEMSARVNPIDPALARSALNQWMRDALRQIQSAIRQMGIERAKVQTLSNYENTTNEGTNQLPSPSGSMVVSAPDSEGTEDGKSGHNPISTTETEG